jgi:hypothetical protein
MYSDCAGYPEVFKLLLFLYINFPEEIQGVSKRALQF